MPHLPKLDRPDPASAQFDEEFRLLCKELEAHHAHAAEPALVLRNATHRLQLLRRTLADVKDGATLGELALRGHKLADVAQTLSERLMAKRAETDALRDRLAALGDEATRLAERETDPALRRDLERLAARIQKRG